MQSARLTPWVVAMVVGATGAGWVGLAPAAEKEAVKPGDVVFVATEGAKLLLEGKQPVELRMGTRLEVVKIQDDWVAGYVVVGGQRTPGWVRLSDTVRRIRDLPPPVSDVPPRVSEVPRRVPDAVPATSPNDWPHFRGPNCDGLCPETGLLQQWPEGGPKLLWTIEGLGKGYSSVSVADGKIFTMGDRTPGGGSEEQFVIALDVATGEELWASPVGPPHNDGPRCTPTVDGELLYAIGTEGHLVCLETARGQLRWHRSFPDEFGGKMMTGWKYSESPLVDGERLVCTPGGPAATIVALDKKSGRLIWRCPVPDIGGRGKDGAGYASMVVAEVGGVRQYIQILGRGAVGVEAATGRFLWGYNRIANPTANIPTPVVRGDYVFVTTSYRTGSALLKLSRNGNRIDAQEVYFLGPNEFENHHGGVVLVGDHIYGGSGQNNGTPVCLEFATGKIAWKGEAPGRRSAAVLYADGHLYFRYEDGLVALVEATPEAFRLKGTFRTAVKNGPSWPHPVIHDGKLYLRDKDALMCYDVRQG